MFQNVALVFIMAEFLFSVVIELLTNDGNRKIIPKYFVYTFLLQLCVVYGMVREGDGKAGNKSYFYFTL